MKPAPPVTRSFTAVALLQVGSGVVAEHQPASPAVGRPIARPRPRGRATSPGCGARRGSGCGRARPSARSRRRSARSRRRSTCTARRRCRRGGCPAPMIAGPRTTELISSAPASIDDPALRRATGRRRGRRSRVLDRVEHEPVAVRAAGPSCRCRSTSPARISCAHAVAVVEEPLDRVGDLELAARRRFDRAHRVVDRRVEEVHADEREIGRADRPASRRGARCRRRRRTRPRRTARDRRRARAGSARPGGRRSSSPSSGGGARAASNASTNVRRSCCSMLSPRYTTKSSSPRKSRAMSTQWARPRGASCWM